MSGRYPEAPRPARPPRPPGPPRPARPAGPPGPPGPPGPRRKEVSWSTEQVERPYHEPDVVETVLLPPARPAPASRDQRPDTGMMRALSHGIADTGMMRALSHGLGDTGLMRALSHGLSDTGIMRAVSHGFTDTGIIRALRGRRAQPRYSRSARRTRLRSAAQIAWLSRSVLAAILCVQAALSLRMRNTAFEDEALYLYSGHMEIVHWLHGVSAQGDYASFLSGAPVLYPALGALADAVGGLAAARLVSLLAMLATTTLLYALTRRLFNERTALCAAGMFAVTESAIFLGNLATYDASALFLLALAAWIVVRTASWRWPGYMLAAPTAALAVAVKYAALLFVPTIVVLTGLVAIPYTGRRALIRPVALGLAVGGILSWALWLGGPGYRQGIGFTTLSRAAGTTPTGTLLHDSLLWGGVPFAVAVVGVIAYARRALTQPGEAVGTPPGGWLRRTALGVVLTGTALLAPAEQLHLHTDVSLQKHIGFGLFFAAPIAGVGLMRIVGDHFRRAPIGIAVWVLALALGMTQASQLYAGWPNSGKFVADLSRYVVPGGHYLVEADEVPIFYLLGNPDAQPDQFTSTFYIGYTDPRGQFLTGNAGYVAAIRAGYFQVISYNFQTTPGVDKLLAKTLETDPGYRLQVVLPDPAHRIYQYVWVKTTASATAPASPPTAGEGQVPGPVFPAGALPAGRPADLQALAGGLTPLAFSSCCRADRGPPAYDRRRASAHAAPDGDQGTRP